MAEPAPTMTPLRLGGPEVFARVRDRLRRLDYLAPRLLRELKLEALGAVPETAWDDVRLAPLPGPLATITRLLLLGQPVSGTALAEAVSAEVVADLEVLDVIRPDARCPGSWVATVWLYPVADRWIASDRFNAVGSAGLALASDAVFPAVFPGTLRFLELLPSTEGEALDLCGGTGIGALLLARRARAVTTADITERSAHFARFNAWLNDQPQVDSVAGDLYQPVAGRQFDLIVAHPPYVPAMENAMVFRDAGPGGEAVTEGIVRGLPNHLRPGGTAMLVCLGRDTATAVFERRAREWLGAAGDEFDIVFALQRVREVAGLAIELGLRRTAVSGRSAEDYFRLFHELGTEHFVHGALCLRRRAYRGGEPGTQRVQITPAARGVDLERLLLWRDRTRAVDFSDWLSGTHPQPAEGLVLQVRQPFRGGAGGGAGAGRECTFALNHPFESFFRLDSWAVALLQDLDGTRTVGQVHAEAVAGGHVPPGFGLGDWVGLVALLVDRGYWVVPAEVT